MRLPIRFPQFPVKPRSGARRLAFALAALAGLADLSGQSASERAPEDESAARSESPATDPKVTANQRLNESTLRWASLTADLEATAEQSAVEAWFAFENATGERVEIIDVAADCGCVSSLLDRGALHPGESGTLVAAVDLEEHVGLVEKRIAVRSRAPSADGSPAEREDVLTIRVRVASPLAVEPLPPAPDGARRFRLRNALAHPIEVAAPPAVADQLRIEADQPGQTWTATWTPERPDAAPPHALALVTPELTKRVLLDTAE